MSLNSDAYWSAVPYPAVVIDGDRDDPLRADPEQLRGAFRALLLEGIVTARIQRQLSALQVQDVIHHIVQQIALMADHHQRCGIGFQEVLQPQRRFQIEVV